MMQAFTKHYDVDIDASALFLPLRSLLKHANIIHIMGELTIRRIILSKALLEPKLLTIIGQCVCLSCKKVHFPFQ